MRTLKIIAKSNERVFKQGDAVELTLMEGQVNYVVGPNGSGKSTIMHAIRAYKDTIYENTPFEQRMEIGRNHDLQLYQGVFDIEGLEQYTNVFALDATVDNPVSFENASTATALIHGGGFAYSRGSRGEGTKFMMSRFINHLTEITGGGIDKETKKIKNKPEAESLIIIDEMDEGLDIKAQSTFYRLLGNLCRIFNATVICVCHNPLCILADPMGGIMPVYDMVTRSYKPIKTYIKEQTGLDITINRESDGKEQ